MRAHVTRASLIFAGLIVGFGVLAFVVTVRSGRQDSALLFVGLPVLIAAALALTGAATTHGRVFQITTIGLLLAAVALHEGAICVILAAPLVYAVVHGVTAWVRWLGRNSRLLAVLPVPLLFLVGVEGTDAGLRIHPDQTVTVTRVVALAPAEVAARVAAGPHPVAVRSLPLRLLGVPAPQAVSGGGTGTGDRWMFAYHGSAHGPGGHIVTEVTADGPDRVAFTVVTDTTINARWFAWRDAGISWRPVGAGRTEVRVRLGYRRGLDPSWYFGPLQDGLLHAGAGHLLDMLELR